MTACTVLVTTRCIETCTMHPLHASGPRACHTVYSLYVLLLTVLHAAIRLLRLLLRPPHVHDCCSSSSCDACNDCCTVCSRHYHPLNAAVVRALPRWVDGAIVTVIRKSASTAPFIQYLINVPRHSSAEQCFRIRLWPD